LWVLRDGLGLTGTKYGCGIGQCGTCTVHLDGKAVRSCKLQVSQVGDKEIVTIEGLSPDGSHPVQRAFMEEDVPQCGYCMPGQVMQAAALLAENPNPRDEDIDGAMRNVLCRCGAYPRIRKAIQTIMDVSFERPRDLLLKTSPQFQEMRRPLWELLHVGLEG
jgi:aerobic-type carbon monoxide dehydrogenase small subunit (CoxS/CutS family)